MPKIWRRRLVLTIHATICASLTEPTDGSQSRLMCLLIAFKFNYHLNYSPGSNAKTKDNQMFHG